VEFHFVGTGLLRISHSDLKGCCGGWRASCVWIWLSFFLGWFDGGCCDDKESKFAQIKQNEDMTTHASPAVN